MEPLKICFVSSETTPFAKTGGLADVVAALARHLGRAGHDARIVLPLYRRIRESGVEITPQPGMEGITLAFGPSEVTFSIATTPLPDSDVPVHLVDCPEFFDRPDIYTGGDEDAVRFALLCRASIEMCQRMGSAPDVFHLNDWHAGLLPLYLKTVYVWDELFASTRTLLTIHNIGYQGNFPAGVLDRVGLGNEYRHVDHDDLRDGRVSFLKTGLIYADGLTTVSETYAREIQTGAFGMGLEGMLKARSADLVGIVNGVDYGEWNPETDALIPFNYSPEDLDDKRRNKQALRRQFELDENADVPLFGIVSRLVAQKGFELLPDALPVLLHRDAAQLVVLGSGESSHEGYFAWLREAFPGRVGYENGYSEKLAHLIEAGADLFLMPSRYEPCGLNQMYSLKYGTVPIVRKTGGLADTVVPYDHATGEGTGFVFEEFSSSAMLGAMRAALVVYRDGEAWTRLVRAGMAQDFSWERQGAKYEELYRRLVAGE